MSVPHNLRDSRGTVWQLKLPNAHLAVIEREKIVDYLLNPAHPDNAGKAQFFSALGFSRDEWQSLAIALCQLAETNEAAKSMETSHGQKYVLDGRIESPSEKKPLVRTIWIVDRVMDGPRLVTAYPH